MKEPGIEESQMDEFKRIRPKDFICDICNKPVDNVTWYVDHSMRSIIIKAYCHGDIDVAKMTEMDWFEIVSGCVKTKIRPFKPNPIALGEQKEGV